MSAEEDFQDITAPANRALDRMRKAYESRKGVRLSYEDLASMSITTIGELWCQDCSPSEAHDKL